MKLQSVRIKTNDFPKEQKELADALGGILNPFIDKLVIGFNKNFTVDDNLPFEFKTIDVENDALGDLKNSVIINTGLLNCKGYICVNVLDIGGGLPSQSVSVFSTTKANFVTINKITGLLPDVKYRLVLMGIS
jgi:hypothetical protein